MYIFALGQCTSFHHRIRGTIPHMYLSTPLQESSDVIISGLRSELSSLNQKLEEMTSYHQAEKDRAKALEHELEGARATIEVAIDLCTCMVWNLEMLSLVYKCLRLPNIGVGYT